MPLTPGTRLGPYEITALIGAGGMGEVYKARDTRLDRMVAVKTSLERLGERFSREARAIAALNHPHICQIYDVGPDYLVMEFIDGAPLLSSRNGEPLPLAQALTYAIEICGALDAAHRKGIIHRDLKPANILVTASCGIKLLDFGLAKFGAKDLDTGTPFAEAADVTRTLAITGRHEVIGTAPYMSPEQAQGKILDQRSDIFSFGAVLYEMLAGSPAFSGDSTIGILSAVVRDHPRPLKAPPAIARVVTRCLSKSPADRYQSVAEIIAALKGYSAKPGEEGTDNHPSIAVLPFANMSADKDQEYFSDGLTEEIINALAQISELKVTARTSAFAVRGKELCIAEIAQMLNVQTILEGSVRKMGNRVRITAQLINAADGYHLWSHRFDGDLSDVFALQDEISASIAATLRVKLVKTAAARHQPGLAAYEAYLRGRYHILRNTPDALTQATASLNEAIRLDPGYAAPHAELGVIYYLLAAWGLRPTLEAITLARTQAARALELSPEEAQGHVVLGAIAAVIDRDWEASKVHFERALAVDPTPPDALARYAIFYLCPLGRAEEALTLASTLMKDDPLNFLWPALCCACLSFLGRYQESIEEGKRSLGINPAGWLTLFFMALNYTALDRLPEARGTLETIARLAPWNLAAQGILAGVCAKTGDLEEAREILAMLKQDPARTNAALGIALYYLFGGDNETAAGWYIKSLENRDAMTIVILGSAVFRPLRSTTLWPKIATLLSLPDFLPIT